MKPRAILLIFFSFTQFLNAQVIAPLGSGLTLKGSVYDIALEEQNGKRYAVGDFSGIDNVKMQGVGVWQNGSWSAISDTSAIDGVVFCAEVYEESLYIGGRFTISGKEIINLAKLENGEWQPLGVESMSGSIRDLVWFEEALYVTGDFRGINGIINNGVMKYANGEWENSGLHSYLNAQGLFVSGDTLFAWGNGFSTAAGNTHTVSYFSNNTWVTLPSTNFGSAVINSCINYNGNIYITEDNQLFVYDFDTEKWELVAETSSTSESSVLFEYQGVLHVVFDGSDFYQLVNGNLMSIDFQNSDSNLDGSIHTVTIDGDKILLGGNFDHWDSQSVSLAVIDNNNLSSLGTVSSHITNIDSWNYSVGNSILPYQNKFLITGIFDFADDIYSPNIVYWDGIKFIPFEVPLPDGIRQLELFEGELYALPWGNFWSDPTLKDYPLIKFNGTKWVGVYTPLDTREIEIIGDKLFILDKYEYFSGSGGPYYLQNGSWKLLKPFPVNGNVPFFDYGNIRSYKNGCVMVVSYWPVGDVLAYLPSDTSDWEILDTIGVGFDYVHTFEDRIFLSERGASIYEFSQAKIDTIATGIGSDYASFFKIKDEIFYSAWNEAMYHLNDQNELDYYSHFRVRDVEKLDEQRYLVALSTNSYLSGLEIIPLNNIGIFTFPPLEVEVEKDKQSVCQNKYIQFWPVTKHNEVSYHWEFEGGIPRASDAHNPMVRYPTSGIFSGSFLATNADKDTVYSVFEVTVDACSTPAPRNNNYDNHWIMGAEYWEGRGLGGFDFTFPDSVIAARYLSPIDLLSGSTIMSDINGNLQYYSNGVSVRNMHNQLVEGSDCLNSTYNQDYYYTNQSVLSLPSTDTDSLYYLFDLDPLAIQGEYWAAASNLSMTTVDMRKNNGEGAVEHCNEEIISDILLNSTMQATRHQNGKDWWIIVGKYQSEEYYKILLTDNGITTVTTSNWNTDYQSPFSGQSTFSPDGKYFAQVIKENQEVAYWRFNNENGELYDKQVYTIVPLDEFEYPQGCSFSPDSRFLYVSSRTQIRQIDLCNYDEIDVELIGTWDGSYEFIYPLLFGKQMLTPDQQIVVTPVGNGHKSFGIIEAPNQKGNACGFRQHALQIDENTRNLADVLPVFPHFRNYQSYTGECQTVSTVSVGANNSFSVYPNPVLNSFTLHFNQTAKGKLYDMNGKMVFSFGETDYLDIDALVPGMYIIKTDLGTQQFIKQ